MPLIKARDVGDLPPPVPVAGAGEAMERALALGDALTPGLPPLFPPGVRRYPSLAAAQADREAALRERMRALRRARAAAP